MPAHQPARFDPEPHATLRSTSPGIPGTVPWPLYCQKFQPDQPPGSSPGEDAYDAIHSGYCANCDVAPMKAHIAVDADSGLVHTVTTTAGNEADVEQIAELLDGKEEQVWADSGYRGAQVRVERENLQHIADER